MDSIPVEDGKWPLTFMRERPCARPRSYSGKLIYSSLIFATAFAHQMQLLTSDRPLAERLQELKLGEHVEYIDVT